MSSDTNSARPDFRPSRLNDNLSFRIRGRDIQTVEFRMDTGTRILVEPGAFLAGAGGVRNIAVSFGDSPLDPLKRMWSGEEGVLQDITCEERPARVVVGAPKIGRIVHFELDGDQDLIAQRGAFIAGTGEIDLNVAFTMQPRAALFGGQGLTFQRISGRGDVFLHATGSLVRWTVAEGEVARVSTNNVLAFTDSVGYDVQFSGGLMAMMLGGQGAFLTNLEGPGEVMVQSVDHDAFIETMGDMDEQMRKHLEEIRKELGNN